MYYLIVLLIIFGSSYWVFKLNNKKVNFEKLSFGKRITSFSTLIIIIMSTMIALLAFSILPFISPTEEIVEKEDLTPVSIANHDKGKKGTPIFIARTHKHGDNQIFYSSVGEDGNTHFNLVPAEQSTYYERRDITFDRVKHKKHPYVEITMLHYKDTFWNEYFFMNSNQPIHRNSNIKYVFYLPTGGSADKYVVNF